MSLERLPLRLARTLAAGRLAPPLPLDLGLPGGAVLHCERLLRWLPGKRAVFAAQLGGQLVCAKWFAPAGRRQWARERLGWQALQRGGIAVPDLLGDFADGGMALRIYRWVMAAGPWFDGLQPPPSLQPLLDLLLQCYRAGLWVEDLHAGNFLADAGGLQLVDAGAIAIARQQPLAVRLVVGNLGSLVAQFRRCDHAEVVAQILAHAVAQCLPPRAAAALQQAAEQRFAERKWRYWRKLLRASTAIAGGTAGGYRWLAARELLEPGLQRLLAEPAELRAMGGTAFAVDGRQLWAAQHPTGCWPWLPPALREWQQQHWLPWEGVPALRPVAVVFPARRFPGRPGWLLSELPRCRLTSGTG